MIKATINIEDGKIQEAVNKELSRTGLLRFIRAEINNVFHSWQGKRSRVALESQIKSLQSKISHLEKRIGGEK